MRRSWAAAVLGLAALAAMAPTASAGPGRYDPKTKTFKLTYTYAEVPSADDFINDPTGAQAAESGTGDEAQDPQIQQLLGSYLDEVNGVLAQITGGLGQIDPNLTYVTEVGNADLVIVLNRASNRVALCTNRGAGAGTGAQGQCNIYKQAFLTQNVTRQGAAQTVAHELCHYIFSLPDEYDLYAPSAFELRCPASPGPGCLMDNYFVRGFGGWLCDSSTHPHSPGSIMQPSQGISTGTSCKDVMLQFFRNQGVDTSTFSTSPTLLVRPTAGMAMPTAVPAGVISQVAGDPKLTGILSRLRAKRGGLGKLIADDVTGLRLEAQALIQKLVTGDAATGPSIFNAALQVVEELGIVPTRLSGVEAELVGLARAAAAGLAAGAGPAQKQLDVRNVLLKALPGLLGLAPGGFAPSPEELSYLDRIAGNATGPVAPRKITFVRPKAKQTMIIAPAPIYSGASTSPDDPQGRWLPPDLVRVQGKDFASYAELRIKGVRQFTRLLRSRNVRVLSPFSAGGPDQDDALGYEERAARDAERSGIQKVLDAIDKVDRTKTPNPLDAPPVKDAIEELRKREASLIASRSDDVQATLKTVQDRVLAGEVNRVFLLVPPGGLPRKELDGALPALRDAVIGKVDVRLDIILVGTATVAPALRDLALRSGGVVTTIADVDEIGAMAQLLANRATGGSWVIVPERGRIVVGERVVPPPDPFFEPLFERLSASREAYSHTASREALAADGGKHDGDLGIRVMLTPFYCDGGTELEVIVGLSQPLTIAGITPDYVEADASLFQAPELVLKAGDLTKGLDAAARARLDGEDNAPDGAFDGFRLDVVRAKANARSTENMLVFRIPGVGRGGPGAGWYTPVLRLAPANFKVKDGDTLKLRTYNRGTIDYTFSIGKPRTKERLIGSLVQAELSPTGTNPDPNVKPAVVYRGTLNGSRAAVIEAQVFAGGPVRGAEVTGSVQRLDDGGRGPVKWFPVTFRDGEGRDQQAGDGVYTAEIGLGADRLLPGEYRVWVAARTTPTSTLAPTGESIQPGTDSTPPAPLFQRATVVNFRVDPKAD